MHHCFSLLCFHIDSCLIAKGTLRCSSNLVFSDISAEAGPNLPKIHQAVCPLELHPSHVTQLANKHSYQNFRDQFNWVIDPAITREEHDAISGTWSEFSDPSGSEINTADTLPLFLDLSIRPMDTVGEGRNVDWNNETT